MIFETFNPIAVQKTIVALLLLASLFGAIRGLRVSRNDPFPIRVFVTFISMAVVPALVLFAIALFYVFGKAIAFLFS